MGSPVCEWTCLAVANLRCSAPGRPVPSLPLSHWRLEPELSILHSPLLARHAGSGPTQSFQCDSMPLSSLFAEPFCTCIQLVPAALNLTSVHFSKEMGVAPKLQHRALGDLFSKCSSYPKITRPLLVRSGHCLSEPPTVLKVLAGSFLNGMGKCSARI